jgi:XRE family aerobic/anaerobic benzoate catabolism transcriptional regulator
MLPRRAPGFVVQRHCPRSVMLTRFAGPGHLVAHSAAVVDHAEAVHTPLVAMVPTQLSQRLAGRVRSLRTQHGLTVRELATRSGLSPRLLALIESGDANPTLLSLGELAGALGVDVPELLRRERQRSVALLGLRGAGKSTIGRSLASALGWTFIELDRRIEADSGLSLSALFELHGEQHVRHVEARVLAEVIAEAPVVVACGGGIVTSTATWETLRSRALTVWLQATPQEHWDRVRAQGDERPMAQRSSARAELDALWSARAALYAHAELHVDTSTLSVNEATERIRAATLAPPH